MNIKHLSHVFNQRSLFNVFRKPCVRLFDHSFTTSCASLSLILSHVFNQQSLFSVFHKVLRNIIRQSITTSCVSLSLILSQVFNHTSLINSLYSVSFIRSFVRPFVSLAQVFNQHLINICKNNSTVSIISFCKSIRP